ncbi:MAG: DUF721 domain-containing protein [Elusimicrobiota bacterium]
MKPGEHKSFSAKESINHFLRALGFDPSLYAIFELWDRETRGTVKGCEAVAIRGRVLHVKVPSTVHRQEILYSKTRLIDRLNQAMGRKAIIDIQFELPGQTVEL